MTTIWETSMNDEWRNLACPTDEIEPNSSFFKHWLHDVRQPLTTLRLIAGTLPAHAESLPESAELQALNAACRQMEEMVASMADFYSLATGDLADQGASFDVCAMLAELVQSRQPRARAVGQYLGALLPSGPAKIVSDRTLLSRVISNLLENAFTHGRPGGRVTVTLQQEGSTVRINVEDDGPGFSPDFELTQSGARRAKGQGQGIGLLFCTRAVRALGGQLAVHDGPGGARLRVELPCGFH